MIGEFRTGLITAADGTDNPPRSDRQGALVVSQDGGPYEEPGLRGQLCYSHCAIRAMSVPATSMIGNIVWNPPGSGYNLSLCKWSARIHATSATATGVDLAYAAQAITPTTTTVADSYGSTFLNAGSPGNCIAKAYAIGTLLVVPTVVMNLFHNTAAIATTGVDKMDGDLEGSWVVPPGYIICLAASTAAFAASSVTSTLIWKEIPA